MNLQKYTKDKKCTILNYCIMFILVSSVAINSSIVDTAIKTDSIKSSTFWYSFSQADSLHIPLYEKYPIISNYIFNQMVLSQTRGTTIGGLSGVSIGLIRDFKEESMFIPYSFIYGIIGGIIGYVSGTLTGIFKGDKYNKLSENNHYFHTRRMQFGYQYHLATFSPFISGGVHRHKGIEDLVGWFIIFRPLSYRIFIPDKIELGIEEDWWGQADYYNESFGRLYLHRAEIRSRYDLFKQNLFTAYMSVGLGYQWGFESDYTKTADTLGPFSNDYNFIDYPLNSPCLRIYAGSEINLFDFIFADMAVSYEPVGAYLFAKNKKYFPYIQNFQISISFGTYVF